MPAPRSRAAAALVLFTLVGACDGVPTTVEVLAPSSPARSVAPVEPRVLPVEGPFTAWINEDGRVAGYREVGSSRAYWTWTRAGGASDLPFTGNASGSEVWLGNGGHVAGFTQVASRSRLTVWSPDGTVADLGPAPPHRADINRHGTVAVLGHVGGPTAPLAPIPAPAGGVVHFGGPFINDAGQAAGTWVEGGTTVRLFRWSAAEGSVDLGVGTSTGLLELAGLDADGRVYATLADGTPGAVVWRCLRIGLVGGVPSVEDIGGAAPCRLMAVSERGVVAMLRWPDGEFRVHTWSPEAGHTLVPGLEGWSAHRVNDINDHGHLVTRSADGRSHAFWDGATLRPIEAAGLRIANAFALNDRDQVVAVATDAAFQHFALLFEFGPELPLEDAFADLAADAATAFAAAGLPAGTTRSVLAKLDAALAAWQRGDLAAARGALAAFVAELRAMVRSGRLSADAAAPLLEAAREASSRIEEEAADGA